jgi:hypothetical protein
MALFFLLFIQMRNMTIENFETLSEQQKVQLIFEANKITEKVDNEANYQLFEVDNFYVEAKTSLQGKFKRSFITYTIKELPVCYATEVLSIPIVVLNNQTQENDLRRTDLKLSHSSYSTFR